MNYTMSVLEFMKKHKQYAARYPSMPPQDVIDLRLRLIDEEVQELKDAIVAGDLYLIADALADIKYVVFGAEITFGIVVNDSIFEIVHHSNMSKDILAHQIGKAEKVEKGSSFKSPNKAIVAMIDAAIKMGKPNVEVEAKVPAGGINVPEVKDTND